MCETAVSGRPVKDALGLGCMRMAPLTVDEAEKTVMDAFDHGVRLFDHADIYGGGESETIFGRVLQRHPDLRNQMLIQDKCGICAGFYDASREHILEAVDGSLRRLGVEALDILLLHRPDALMEPEEVAEAFETLRRTGKVRRFGVSNMNSAQIRLLSQAMPEMLTVNQLQFGLGHSTLVDEGINVNTDVPQAIERTGSVLDECRLRGMEVQAWSPLQYGMFQGLLFGAPKYAELNKALGELAEKYKTTAAAVAIAWILRHPARIRVILGTMNPLHLKDGYDAANLRLTRPEWYRLYAAAGNPIP